MNDLWTRIIAEDHGFRYSIHPGSMKMYHDLKQIYWWDGMKKYIAEYVAKCPNCKQVKVEHLKLGALTQVNEASTWKWEAINMDFMVCLLTTRRQHDSIWVIEDRMTKSAHFIPVKSTYKVEDYARLYIDETLRWRWIPLSFISDRGAQFTSHFWRSFQKILGTQVKLSSAFLPQTDRQAERTI